MEGGSLSRILAFDYGHGYALDAMKTSEKEFTFTHHLYSVKMWPFRTHCTQGLCHYVGHMGQLYRNG